MAFGYIDLFYFPIAGSAGSSLWGTDVRKLLSSPDATSDNTSKTVHGTGGTVTRTVDPYTSKNTDDTQADFGWAIDPSDMNSISGAQRRFAAGNHSLQVRFNQSGAAGASITIDLYVYRVGNAAGGRVRTLLGSGSLNFNSDAAGVVSTRVITANLAEIIFGVDETIQYSCEITAPGVAVTGRNCDFRTGTQSSVVTAVLTPSKLDTILETTGSSSGTGTASGVGGTILATTGSATGSGSASGVAAAFAQTTGAAAGTSSAAGVAATLNEATGTAAGTSTAVGQAATVASGEGSAAGTSIAIGESSSVAATEGIASGTSTATGIGGNVAGTTGSSDGASTAAGVAALIAQTTGTAQGTSTATGVSGAESAGTGSASGSSTAAGVGGVIATTTGTAAGTCTVVGLSQRVVPPRHHKATVREVLRTHAITEVGRTHTVTEQSRKTTVMEGIA